VKGNIFKYFFSQKLVWDKKSSNFALPFERKRGERITGKRERIKVL
jgi:hypothetical protein